MGVSTGGSSESGSLTPPTTTTTTNKKFVSEENLAYYHSKIKKLLGDNLSNYLKNNKGNFVEYTNHVNNLDVLYEAGVYSFYDLLDGRPPHFVAGWGVVIVLDGGDFKSQILIGNYDYPAFAIRPWDPATNAWAGWNVIDGWKSTILYSGATNGNLTLADDVENYDYIEIFYDASNNLAQNSMKVKVNNVLIGNICLTTTDMDSAAFPNNFGFINNNKRITISGKNLTVVAQGRWWRYKSDSNSVIDSNNDIWIHTILGYKEV